MVLRKKGLGGRERTASVSTIEGWCKGRGENTGEESRQGTDAEGEKWAFKKGKKVQRSPIRGKEKEVGEILKEMRELEEELYRIRDRTEEELRKKREDIERIEKDMKEMEEKNRREKERGNKAQDRKL